MENVKKIVDLAFFPAQVAPSIKGLEIETKPKIHCDTYFYIELIICFFYLQIDYFKFWKNWYWNSFSFKKYHISI